MNDTSPMKEKKIFKINIVNKRSINNSQLNMFSDENNKISLECSYLMNEIKRKNKLFLASIKTGKNINKLNIKKSFNSEQVNNNYLKKLFNKSKEVNKNKERDFPYKINMTCKKNNLNKSISLTSLINLPKVKTRNKINIRQKIIKNNNFGLNFHKKNTIVKGFNPKQKNPFSLKKFMKENFYSDIENKYSEQIKTKYFRNDPAIKKEIITLKKVGAFWRKFAEYCGPIIRVQRYQLMRKYLFRRLDNNKLKLNRASSMIDINKLKC